MLLETLSFNKTDIAIFTSKLKLGLVDDNGVIEFTHHLLNNGLYDDAMLPIIDADPIYGSICNDDFYKVIESLGLKMPTLEQAKWLFSYVEIFRYATKPYDYTIFGNNNNGNIYATFECFFDDGLLKDIKSFQNILYRLDDAEGSRYNGYLQKSYNDDASLNKLKYEFFDACEKWLILNQKAVEQVVNALVSKFDLFNSSLC